MKDKPKALKEINISTHTMKTRHGVTTVKQHTATREVNITTIDNFFKKASEITDPENQLDKIIDLYKIGFHAITDKYMDDHPESLKTIFEEALNVFNLNKNISTDMILKKITNPEHIKNISKKVDEIQSVLSNKLGNKAKIERLSPFTFSIEHGMPLPPSYSIRNIHDAMDCLLIRTKTSTKGTMFNTYSPGALSSTLKNIESMMKDYPTYLNSTIKSKATSDLLVHMYNYLETPKLRENTPEQKFTNDVPKETVNLINSFLKGKSESLASRILNHDKNTPPTYLFHTDTEKIRKEMITHLNDKEVKKSGLSKILKQARSNEVPIIINFISKTGKTPNFMMDNPSFSKELVSLVENHIKSPYNTQQSGLDKFYVTKNPLEYLNMSPIGRFESCQSIVEEGEIQVDEFNANVLSSFTQDLNHDFIIHTAIKEGQDFAKTARLSVQYNPKVKADNLVNQEGNLVHGNNDKHMNLLKKFADVELNMADSLNNSYDDIEISVLNAVKSVTKDSNKDLLNISTLSKQYASNKSIDISKEIVDTYAKVVTDIATRLNKIGGYFFINKLKEGESIHYDAPLHRAMIDTVEPAIDSIARYLDREIYKTSGIISSGLRDNFFDFSRKHNIKYVMHKLRGDIDE